MCVYVGMGGGFAFGDFVQSLWLEPCGFKLY